MIEAIKQHFDRNTPLEIRLNKSREMLQLVILKVLHDRNLFQNIAFQGGTALRVVFDLKRFSEDLDFSLIHQPGYDSEQCTQLLQKDLSSYNLPCEIKLKSESTVHHLEIRFVSVMQALGLSRQKGQKMLIKVEIDTNPPRGGATELTLVNKGFLTTIRHFTLPSLFATKLHACFYRKYVKGRDYYDLLWFLGKKTIPDFALFNRAAFQTEGVDPAIGEHNFYHFLHQKVSSVDFNQVKMDVAPFIEDKNELRLLDRELILKSAADIWKQGH